MSQLHTQSNTNIWDSERLHNDGTTREEQQSASDSDVDIQDFSLAQIESSHLNLFEIVHEMALETWLSDVPADKQSITTAEDAKPLIEACYHSCSLGAWAETYRLATMLIGVPALPLHECLGRWGQFQDQINLYSKLLNQLSPEIDLVCLDGLGQAHCCFGRLSIALDYHYQHRSLAQRLDSKNSEALACSRLGDILRDQFQYMEAIAQYEQQYELASQVGDQVQQASALEKMGHLYLGEQRIQKGQALLQQALAIAESLSELDLMAKIMESIGFGYLWSNQSNRAIPYLQHSLAHAQQVQDVMAELQSLRNLGMAYMMATHPDYKQALSIWQKALEISQRLHLIRNEELVLTDLALFYSRYCADPDQGLSCMHQAIALAKQRSLDHQPPIAYLARLAWFYLLKNDLPSAEHYVNQVSQVALSPKNSLDVTTKMLIMAVQAKLRWQQRRFILALWLLAKGIWTCPPWRYANGKIMIQEAVATMGHTLISPFLRLKTWVCSTINGTD